MQPSCFVAKFVSHVSQAIPAAQLKANRNVGQVEGVGFKGGLPDSGGSEGIKGHAHVCIPPLGWESESVCSTSACKPSKLAHVTFSHCSTASTLQSLMHCLVVVCPQIWHARPCFIRMTAEM